VAADNRNAASHELTEVVPGRPKNPELWGRKSRVLLCHGHAPCTDIAGNIDLALGSSVHGAVGGITVNYYLSPGIEPSDIIRGRPHDFNLGIGATKGTRALA